MKRLLLLFIAAFFSLALVSKEDKQNTHTQSPAGFVGKTFKKDKGYFSRNILEAQELTKKCEKNLQAVDPEECAAATNAINEKNKSQQDSIKYRKYWEANLNQAIKFAKECEKNPSTMLELRCQIATLVANQEIKTRKEAKKFQSFKENYRNNLEDAKKLLKSGCVEKDIECNAAQEVLEEAMLAKIQDSFLVELRKYLAKITLSADEELQYNKLLKGFSKNKTDIEEFVLACISDPVQAKKSLVECDAAGNYLVTILEAKKEQRDKEKDAKPKNREYYIRYFSENPNEVEGVLNGRCKDVFSDPWYNSDYENKDIECDIALSINNQNKILEKQAEIAKNRKEVKDRGYFIKNNEAAEKLSGECKSGKIENLDECDAAIYVVTEKTNEENKKTEYITYYSLHPLAAKFFVRWCKGAMLNFNIKCQAAEDAVKKHASKKTKIYKEELFNKYINKFKEEPEKAKELLSNKCKDLMRDPWYYLDESIRSEQCDAAAEIARMVVESQEEQKKGVEDANVPNAK